MDILDVIKDEHRTVFALLEEALSCEPGAKRLLGLAKEIEKALTMHVRIEERLFYAPLRERSRSEKELVDMYEAYTEHDVAGHLIALLKSSRKPSEKFKAELQVLSESVKHHVQEEESKMFSLAKKLIDKEERESLGKKWSKAKLRLEAQPPTRSSAKPAVAEPSKAKSPRRPASKQYAGL